MAVLRRSLGVLAACAATALLGPAGAAASGRDYYVAAGASGTTCAQDSACPTIAQAVAAARGDGGGDTIHVGPGTFSENVDLGAAADSGDVLSGAGSTGNSATTIRPAANAPAVTAGNANTAPVTVEHLAVAIPAQSADGIRLDAPTGSPAPAILRDVSVDVAGGAGGTGDGISAGGTTDAPVLDGVSITMESGSSGDAVSAGTNPFVMRNGSVTLAAGATGRGVELGGGTGALTLDHEAIHMDDPGTAGALDDGLGDVVLDHATIDGAWNGQALTVGGTANISDSRVTSGATSLPGPLLDLSHPGGPATEPTVVRRTVVRSAAGNAVALGVSSEDLALDSSAVLGGSAAVAFGLVQPGSNDAYIVSSLLDAGTLGSATSGTSSIRASTISPSSALFVHVIGSIALEPQTDTSSTGTLDSECVDSDVPSQSLRGQYRIACAAGSDGNLATADPASLFLAPGTDYSLRPGASAADAVPESAIQLPSGVSVSSTDLNGNPRVVDGGACAPVRDRGPLELQGHPGTVPDPEITYPGDVVPGQLVTFTGDAPNLPGGASPTYTWSFGDGSSAAGAIVHHAFAVGSQNVNLTVSAGKSCTASVGTKVSVSTPKRAAAPKKPVLSAFRQSGRKLSYHDSVRAKTTFTVARVSTGRRKGTSCVALTRKNRKAKHCTRHTTLGSFTHADAAGKNTVTVPAKLHGKKLAKGLYRILVVARDSAGKSRTATRAYRIR